MSDTIAMPDTVAGICVPDSAIARAATQLVRATEDDLLYNHSRRVFFWGALTGERRNLKYDPELLYLGAMFHDMGLTEKYSSPRLRFEVDGANAARDFMKSYGVPERDVEDVWTAIALHTTPGIPEHMRPTISLVTAGVEMDVLGIAYHDFTREQRDHVCAHHPREPNFKENIIAHFADGIIEKPETTFGNVKADVLALKDPEHFVRGNFCSIILGSPGRTDYLRKPEPRDAAPASPRNSDHLDNGARVRSLTLVGSSVRIQARLIKASGRPRGRSRRERCLNLLPPAVCKR